MTTNLMKYDLKKLYDTDYHQWLENNLQLLKSNLLTEVDLENIIEELESLGRSEKAALKSNLWVLIMHLLKWEYQPEKRSQSWRYTIIEHRRRILTLFEGAPSLKRFFEDILTETYLKAVEDASEETGLPLEHFPRENPYSLEQILSRRLWD